MATLATQRVRRSGLDPSYAAASVGGDKFTPGQDTFLHVKNGGGGAITVTLETPATAGEDVPVTDLAVSVPAGDERLIGPLPGSLFGDATDSGLCDVTYSGVTTVTVAAFSL